MDSAAQALQAFFPEDDDSLERQLRALDGKISAWSQAVEVAQERLRSGGGRPIEEPALAVNGQASVDVVSEAPPEAPPAAPPAIEGFDPEPALADGEIDPDTFFDSPITKRKAENEDEWSEVPGAPDDDDSSLIIKEWPTLKTSDPSSEGDGEKQAAPPSSEPLAKAWSSVTDKPAPPRPPARPDATHAPEAPTKPSVEDGEREREELDSLLASVPAEVAKRVRRMKRMNPDANTRALIERAEQAAEKQAAQEAESGGKKRGPWWRRKA